ncbi:MAG: Crp/Fnr family transcriptional regulator [Candidatus Kapaibacterium sp.]|nr:MAG: Crp/Fnr family transcriptional regulator [Candidatus Kapabacteria bacterium]
METFRHFIENYTSLSNTEWEQISRCCEKRIVEKGEVLLEQGKICKHLYFLERGLLRFYIFKDGNDITKFFTASPYCFTSQVSFNMQKPATENIQALEKSIVWQISAQQVNELFELKGWANFARKITQEVQFFTEEILEDIQTETAEYRFKKMLETTPKLVQRIPLKHLATFLGIAPQSLSRIRKKLHET